MCTFRNVLPASASQTAAGGQQSPLQLCEVCRCPRAVAVAASGSGNGDGAVVDLTGEGDGKEGRRQGSGGGADSAEVIDVGLSRLSDSGRLAGLAADSQVLPIAGGSNTRSWTCLRCTLENQLDATACVLCAWKRPAEDEGCEISSGGASALGGGMVASRHAADPLALADADLSRSLAFLPRTTESLAKDTDHLTQIAIEFAQTGRRFEDPEFPAGDASLGAHLTSKLRRHGIDEVVWLRPSEMAGSVAPSVFAGGSISSDDVHQGMLGDCWFLGALAVLADVRPDMLLRIIVTKELSREGAYVIKLCIDSEWQLITIDDRLPCDPRTRRPLFTSTSGGQLWASLVEKAYAKTHGSYSAIHGGFLADALSDLTGAPCEQVDLMDTESTQGPAALFAGIREALHRNLAVTAECGTEDTPSGRAATSRGLVPTHAYSVLDAVHLSEAGKSLLLVRNPHGRSNFSMLPEDLAMVSRDSAWGSLAARAGQGSFWIPIVDLFGLFSRVVTCLLYEDWNELRYADAFNAERSTRPMPSVSRAHYDMVPLAKEGTKVLISLRVQQERGVPATSDIGMLLVPVGGAPFRPVLQPPVMRGSSTFLVELPGCDIARTQAIRLVPFSLTANGDVVPFVVSLHSDLPLVVRRITPGDIFASSSLVSRGLHAAFLDAPENQKEAVSLGAAGSLVSWAPHRKSPSSPGAWLDAGASTFVFLDARASSNFTLLEVNFANSTDNYVCSRDPAGELMLVQDCVQPACVQLITAMTRASEYGSFRLGFSVEVTQSRTGPQSHTPALNKQVLDLYQPL